MKERRSFTKSLSWGVTLAILITVVAVLVAFVTGAEMSVPGFLEIESDQGAGRPSTEFFFNPLGLVLLGLVLAVVIWGAGRLSNDRRS
jgi:uncharacterized membrane protein YphA (DoxX/SURF4 family)